MRILDSLCSGDWLRRHRICLHIALSVLVQGTDLVGESVRVMQKEDILSYASVNTHRLTSVT